MVGEVAVPRAESWLFHSYSASARSRSPSAAARYTAWWDGQPPCAIDVQCQARGCGLGVVLLSARGLAPTRGEPAGRARSGTRNQTRLPGPRPGSDRAAHHQHAEPATGPGIVLDAVQHCRPQRGGPRARPFRSGPGEPPRPHGAYRRQARRAVVRPPHRAAVGADTRYPHLRAAVSARSHSPRRQCPRGRHRPGQQTSADDLPHHCVEAVRRHCRVESA